MWRMSSISVAALMRRSGVGERMGEARLKRSWQIELAHRLLDREFDRTDLTDEASPSGERVEEFSVEPVCPESEKQEGIGVQEEAGQTVPSP